MMRATLLAAGGVALILTLAACSKKTEETAAGGSGAAAPAASASSAAMPKPTPGKWRMTTLAADMPAGMPALPPVDICITPEMIADDRWTAGPGGKPESCSEYSVTAVGGAVKTHAVCSGGGVTSTIDSTLTGDFRQRYTADTTVSNAPATPGVPNPIRMTATMERVGDC